MAKPDPSKQASKDQKPADTALKENPPPAGATATTETPSPAGAGAGAGPQAPAPATEGPSTESPSSESAGEGPILSPDGTKILKKMSPKTVMGRIKRPFPGDPGDPLANPPVPARPADPPSSLYICMGQSNGIKMGDSDNGPWTAFTGQFQSVRSDTGEIAVSGLCFVPKAFEDLLLGAIKSAQKGDETAMVEFAIEVGIQPDDKAATGYVYWVKNLIKIQGADPLARMRNLLLSNGTLKLPAPKPAA